MIRFVLRWFPWRTGSRKSGPVWKGNFTIILCVWVVLICIVEGIVESPVFGQTKGSDWESANAAGMEAYRQGRYLEAKEWFLKALTETEGSGEPSPSRAMTLNNLAAVHEVLGESEDAELRYRQSLFVIESIQGPNHPDLVPGLHNLALLYLKEGKIQEAEPLLRRRLSILELHLGKNHAHLISSLVVLAQLTQSQGRLIEAEAFFAQALAIADSELDPRHHQTSTILLQYAALLRQMHRDAEAAELEARAEAIRLSFEEKE